jgi:uncharacterized protein YfiM (DUF2279 family)
MKKWLVIMLFWAGISQAQWRNLDWKKDYWDSQNGILFKYDKVDHFVWMTTTTIAFEELISQKNGWKYALLLGVANEVKDALMPWEKYGKIGGEGFSAKDMLANIAGITIGHYLNKAIKKLF